jgi:RNA polymerase sigma-70 factor (ECF subfamily)
MVGASGLSYEEAAAICGVEVGTIKSRLSRARTKLTELLGLNEGRDGRPERTLAAAAGPPGAEVRRIRRI